MSLTIAAYLINIIIFGTVFLFTRNNKFLIANNFILACFAILEILNFFWELFIAYYGGYLSEMITIYSRALGFRYAIFIIGGFAFWILPLLNFRKKFRKSYITQIIILGIYFLPTIAFFIFKKSTVTVFPGTWDVLVDGGTMPGYIICTVIFILLNLAFVYFKVLPEFKTPSKDILYDALIDKNDDQQ